MGTGRSASGRFVRRFGAALLVCAGLLAPVVGAPDTVGAQAPASTAPFTLTVSPAVQSLPPGGQAEFLVEVAPVGTFSGPVALTVTKSDGSLLPAGITGTLSPVSVTPGTPSRLIIKAASTYAGEANLGLQVKGVNGVNVVTAPAEAVVTTALVPICTVSITGIVRSTASGNPPVEGVTVSTVASPVRTATTGVDGRYTITGVSLGPNNAPVLSAVVRASKNPPALNKIGSFWTASATTNLVCGRTSTIDYQLVPVQSAQLGGKVIEGVLGPGNIVQPKLPEVPIPAATAKAFTVATPSVQTASATTGSDGRYRFRDTTTSTDGIQPGINNTTVDYRITLDSPTTQPFRQRYWKSEVTRTGVGPGPTVLEAPPALLVRQCTTAVTGTVVDSLTSAPVSGASVRVSFSRAGVSDSVTVTTEPSGVYSVPAVLFGLNNVPGPLTVRVSRTGYTTQTITTANASCGGTLNVPVSFVATVPPNVVFGAVTGRVLDEDTRLPKAGVSVTASTCSLVPTVCVPVATGADGRYLLSQVPFELPAPTTTTTTTATTVPPVPSATVTISGTLDGFWPGSAQVTVRSGQTTTAPDLQVLTKLTGKVRGKVIDLGTAGSGTGHLAGATVSVTSARCAGTAPTAAECTTPADGSYSIVDVPLGTRNAPTNRTVTATKFGYWSKSETFEARADREEVVDLGLVQQCTVTVTGVVKNASTQVGIPGATVSVPSGSRLAADASSSLPSTVITDGNGRYTLDRLLLGTDNAPKSLRFTAAAAGFVSVSLTDTLVNCGSTIELNFGERPVVTRITPNVGSSAGGEVVEVEGSNLLGTTGVTFGGVRAPSFELVARTASRAPFLRVTTPPGLPVGSVDVVVIVSQPFEVSPPAPAATYSYKLTGQSVHSCTVAAGATARCWGSNASSQLGNGSTVDSATPVAVTGLTGVVQVAAGAGHSCAVVTGGTVRCWGDNSSGQIGNGSSGEVDVTTPTQVSGISSGATQVATGRSHSCAIVASGQVRCWGANTSGQLGNGSTTNSPAPVSVTGISGATQVAVGANHSCVIVSGGQVRCWGANTSGQLGNNTTTAASSAVPVSGLTGAIQIAAGASHTCVVLSSGQGRCWGGNAKGQLGTGTTSQSLVPAVVSGLAGATLVTAGDEHTCAGVTGQTVRCWGANSSGQLGNGSSTSSAVPVATTGTETTGRLFSGGEHTCAVLSSGQLRCWGSNAFGQLGNGKAARLSTVLAATPGISGSTLNAAGAAHSCVVVAGGQVRCWGANSFGQVGNGTVLGATSPVAVTGLSGATRITAGQAHTCVALTGGQVRCWGGNGSGQLGTGTTTQATVPVAVPGLTGVADVAAGSVHTCALLTVGQVRCWGGNTSGQVGVAGLPSSPSPVAVPGISGATAITAGANHTCVIVAGGQVRCWGRNFTGQLGNGTSADSATPVAVTGLSGATRIDAGSGHTCAVVAGGQVRCWGANNDGQLGNGSTANAGSPVAVTGMSGATQLGAGQGHTCVLVAGGQARCWGDNLSGQLGTGSTSDSPTPAVVTSLTGAVALAVGTEHSCALVTGGQQRCWGSNSSSQLGLPLFVSTPVTVLGIP